MGAAAFSMTARRPQGTDARSPAADNELTTESEVVEELVAKLDSEIRGEKDSRNPETYSDTIEEYLKESGYQIHDTPGQEEVILSRKFGDEKYALNS
jgi:Mitochondrial glycoprotein